MEQIEFHSQQLISMALSYLPSLLLAIVVLLVGWWVIGRITRFSSKAMVKLDVSLRTFLVSLIGITLKVLLLISVAGMVGIQTTSFVAILGAAGLAIGLALQGTLANFAGGVLILIFKPYTVGDVIEAQGKTGAVKEIQIFNTILIAPKGETIILPNGAVSNGTIVNITTEGRSLVEIPVELDINTDMEKIRAIALPLMEQNHLILKSPAPSIGITALKPGAVVVAFRAHTLPEDNAAVYGNLIENIKIALTKHNIAAPISRTYVHNLPA